MERPGPDRPKDDPEPRTWPGAARYAYRHGGHELILSDVGVTDREAGAVARGEVELAVVAEGPLVALGFRFGGRAAWAVSEPFRRPAGERNMPPAADLTSESFARLWGTLWITLLDSGDGRVRVRRAVALPPEFHAALLRALRDQAALPRSSEASPPEERTLSAAAAGLPASALSRARCPAASSPAGGFDRRGSDRPPDPIRPDRPRASAETP